MTRESTSVAQGGQLEVDMCETGDSTGIASKRFHVTCGSLVALFVDKYKDEIPQIAKIVSEPSNESDVVEVEWLVGTYSSTFKPCKKREGRSYVPWRETVPYTSILFPVELTKGCRLSQSLKTKLMEAYRGHGEV